MVLRVTVARSAMRERKLWTGKPSSVRLAATLLAYYVEWQMRQVLKVWSAVAKLRFALP
jgi:hypothetical protein